MAETSSSSSSGGIGICGLLFVVFLVLKLTHVISWSWWWITAPLWGPLAALLSFIAIALLVALAAESLKGR